MSRRVRKFAAEVRAETARIDAIAPRMFAASAIANEAERHAALDRFASDLESIAATGKRFAATIARLSTTIDAATVNEMQAAGDDYMTAATRLFAVAATLRGSPAIRGTH